ncbi:MAG: stage V sporulation protein AD [Lachnospiraceae bacterium]|nr:stage V sporulation protein AD [Lachnospiraceae bacterium]
MEQQDAKAPGKQSFSFGTGVYVSGMASVAGKLESEGPLGDYFDMVGQDDMFGGKTWEEAESNMQLKAAEHAIKDAGLTPEKIRYMAGGDLLGQLIATTFGVEKLAIPLLGLYGACSTMGESLLAGAVLVDGGYAGHVLTITSSHFAGAEKQFRFPLAYGNQRPMAATWTVTGSGAVVLSNKRGKYNVRLSGATMGRVIDYGVKDSMNMGACMAPAACDTIYRHLKDFGLAPEYYDRIVTGDLGAVGKEILLALLLEKGFDITKQHMDCGIEIFDAKRQKTDAGGSGCGCSAITLTGYLLKKVSEGVFRRILFVPTGALLSTVSFNEGNSVPGIAHAVVLEYCGEN